MNLAYTSFFGPVSFFAFTASPNFRFPTDTDDSTFYLWL